MRIDNLFLVLLLLLPFGTAYGQCPSDTLMWEDFQSQQVPGSWLNLDRDSLNDRNGRPANWFIVADPISSSPSYTNYVAASNSWFSPAGTSDNWLITDLIEVCDTNLFLVWKSAPFEGPVYMDGYEVLLSNMNSDPATFTTSLKKFAEGIGATAQASSGTVHSAYDGNRGVLQSWRVALGPWLGDTIFIAFRHQSTDDNLIQIDDLGVVRIPSYDAAVVEVKYSTPYPVVPFSQRRPMSFRADLENHGVDTLDALVADLELRLNSQSLVLTTDTILGLLPLKSDSVVSASPYTPTQTGTYVLNATATIDSSDGFPLDNAASITFEVSDSVYARDDGVPAGARSLGGNSGFMGQTYRLYAGDTLTSLSFYLDQPSGQDTLRGAVYAYANNTPGALVAKTDPWPVQPGFSGWLSLGMEGIDRPLAPGTYLVGLEEAATGELNLGYSLGKYTPGSVWHRVETTWATLDALNLDGVYMVRANFGEVDEVVNAAAAVEYPQLSISPNPGPGLFQVEFGAPLKARTALAVTDLSGRTVYQRDLAGGQQGIAIDLGHLPAGIYVLSVGGRNAGRLNVVR